MRNNHLTCCVHQSLFKFSRLLQAYYSCRRNKRNTVNALRFELNMEKSLLRLKYRLQKRTYSPGRSICFVVTHPKCREIFASDFLDRVIHHLLVSEIEPVFDKLFINSSYACRTGKGTHKAVYSLHKAMLKITKNATQPAYYSKLDIESFFTSMDKQTLYSRIYRRILILNKPTIWKEEVLFLCKKIIFHGPTHNYYKKGNKLLFTTVPHHKSLFGAPRNKGLPIGNLTSQFFANVYLDMLDQYLKRELKIKYYFRYVDDIVLLAPDLYTLHKWRFQISKFLHSNLALSLHPDKQTFGSVYDGIDFVGYLVYPKHIFTRKRIVSMCKTKLYYFNKRFEQQEPTKKDIDKFVATINSYFGHFKHSNSYKLRFNLYTRHFKRLRNFVIPQDNLCSFRPFHPPR